MAKSNVPVGENWARAPPPSGPVWMTIAHAFYNPKEKTLLGRTAKRWGIVLTFYMVFYAVLALLFAACMGGLFLVLDPKTPVYTLGQSLIGVNPGVAHRPRPDDGFVVKMDASNVTEQQFYVQQIKEFLEPYMQFKEYAHESCSEKDDYGYIEKPCFFIKLNKIFNWEPECYNNITSLPEDMPDELNAFIKTQGAAKLNQIWMSCWEEKNNETKIEYPWGMGVSAYHYPFINRDGYLSPLLAIQLTPPVNKELAIRCRFWAKNIIYNKSMKEPSGYTRILLHIKDTTALKSDDVANE